MRDPRPGEVWYLTDDQRVTKVGRFLRSSSIDELPELWNVLRGDLSLVGPRPLLTEYLDQYTPEQRRRHDMRPGFTGWAAVNGRHSAKFEDRLALDVWYVDHWSLRLDVRILGLTVMQVLRRSDVSTTQDPAVNRSPAARGGRGSTSICDTDRAGRPSLRLDCALRSSSRPQRFGAGPGISRLDRRALSIRIGLLRERFTMKSGVRYRWFHYDAELDLGMTINRLK